MDLTIEEAFLKLIASRYLSRTEAAVAHYVFLCKGDVPLHQITSNFLWPKYMTSKKIKKLIVKKVILRKYYGTVAINPIWKDWLDGKVAKLTNQVAFDNFAENITDELIKDLIHFAQSRGLQISDAEDAVSTSLLKAKERYHQFKQGTNFRGWIFTIVTNTIADSRKKKKESQLFENELEEIVDGRSSVFDVLELKSKMVQFKDSFSKLHPYYQNLLKFYANEVPYKDVAILLNTPEGTIKSQIHRAKQTFQRLITQHQI
jgi:RNA polymerase sigma-70 factor (ECF subfamily)